MEAYLAVKDSFIFKAKLFSQMKKDVDLMHPLPRADEWGNQYDHDEIDENPNTAIYRQMFNGKAVRQSTIVHVNGNASKIA